MGMLSEKGAMNNAMQPNTETAEERHLRIRKESAETIQSLIDEARQQQFWGEVHVIVGINGGLAVNVFDERKRKRK